ncbi:unnamed protein product [Brassica rapa subsp. narinosa]
MKCSRMAYDQSLHSPNNPHFFQPLLPGFHTYLNIPVAFFLKHVQGSNDHIKTAKLTTDASAKTWLVKVDGVRLTDGWEDFAVGHDLRIGDITIFRHEGEMVFHVTAFGPSCCDIQYTSESSHNINDDSQDQTNNAGTLLFFCNCFQVTGNSSGEKRKRVKKNPRTKEDSSSDHSQFVAHVSPSSLSSDRLYIPTGFARSNGLDNMSGKEIIVLLNEEGRSWSLDMTCNKVGMQTFVRPGWRRFCAENGMKKGHHYTFKLVRRSAPLIIRLSHAEHEPEPATESSLNHSYYVGSVSPNSLSTDKLRHFVTANGLEKGLSEITLKNEWGGSWILGFRHYEPQNHTYLGPGWKTFCQVNGIKAEDSFMFKLVETGDKPVLLLCTSNRGKTPLECSEDRDDVNSLSSDTSSEDDSKEESQESDKESIEDADRSQQCIVMEKENNSLRCICSSPYSKHRFVRLSFTQSALKTSVLYLPLAFTRMNCINKPIKIMLLGKDGVKKQVVDLLKNKSTGAMRFGKGWREFCDAHGVKVGESFQLELFREDEEAIPIMFGTSFFGISNASGSIEYPFRFGLCEFQYTSASSHNINDVITGNSSGEKRKRVKKNPRTKEESSSDHSHFVAHVTPSSLSCDRLYVPKGFAMSNGLDNMSGKEIVLLNEEGKSWNLNITYNESGMHTFVRPGWRRFCAENGISQGHHCTFELVRKSAPPVLRLSRAEHDPKPAPESSLHHSYYVGSASSNSLRIDKLYLQMKFVTANGMKKGFSEIILKNEWGGRWSVRLRQYASSNRTYLGPGWKTFCQVNGIKAGDPFMFKLVETGDKPVLLLCSSNRGETPLECSDDVNSLSSDTSSGEESQESEEESLEDDSRSKDCVEMEKRKSSLRCKCSSSYSKHRFVRLTLTQNALKTSVQHLPLGFTRVNGINRSRKIMLLGKDGVKKWVVDLLKNKSTGAMRIRKGWRELCDAHGVKVGESFLLELIRDEEAIPVLKLLCPEKKTPVVQYFLILCQVSLSCSSLYEGEMVFHVTAFGPSCCDIQYTSASSHNINDDITGNSSGEKRKRVKKTPRTKEESSSDHSHFMAHVSPSSLRFDRLYVPISFARSNGLDNMSGKEIVLLNQEGRSWNLNITYTKASVQTLVGPGWRRFCAENGMNQGHHYTFKLVGKSAPPVIRLSLAEPAPESSLHHSNYVGSVSSNSLRKDKLYIHRKFVNANGLKGLSEIVLKNEWGGSWNLGLRYYESLNHTYLGPGWKTFCQVNGIKTGDSFMFKVVETGDKPVLLLCTTNRGKTPLDCPEDSNDVNSLSSDTGSGESQESEEESLEDDDSSSEESFEMVKRENSSRCRASSSYSQDRFVKLTLTPRALKTYKLMLPLDFTRVNGINKPGKITLLDKDGAIKKVVDLLDQNRNIGIMRLGKGWREFCDAHGVKVGQSFLLELIWEDEEAIPVLKFCTKL